MNKAKCIVVLLLALTFVCSAQNKKLKPNKRLLKVIDQNFKDGASQYNFQMKNIPEGKFPKTYYSEEDKLEFSGSDWWCSGFYPGTLLYLYEQTKQQTLLTEADRMLNLLKKEQFNKTTHDLGFMMYCSFGNANRITPKPEYKDILINSAKSLSTRFNPTAGAIKSWDNPDPSKLLVIIDNMMNLKLLFWATQVTGDSSYYKIAVTHANTTLKNHFRDDRSSFHLITYNATDGTVRTKTTVQGAADTSAWARGQSWGLYGFTETYRETKDKKYLDQAKGIAKFILDNPNLPADKIPYWDFDAPGIPNALRDASAGAVIASALIELSGYVDKPLAKKYKSAAETILFSLSSDQYKATRNTNGGYILKHSVGHFSAKSEVDVPLTYADYYFIEAMKRYKDLGN
ncbi:MAG TPA: glycoside hydrolase family 88 protein [Pedobacter sp.]